MSNKLKIYKSMLRGSTNTVIAVALSSKEEVKEGELSRAQIRKSTECHANWHALYLVSSHRR